MVVLLTLVLLLQPPFLLPPQCTSLGRSALALLFRSAERLLEGLIDLYD